jgi:hypothetical protein
MAVGWIKISRNIQECDLWVDDEPFDRRSAWIDLLLMANHEDKTIIFDGNPVVVQRGQRITSIRKLSERWHWSRTKVSKFLDILEYEERITKVSDTKKTLLTIVKYEDYQSLETEKSHRKATEKPQKSTNKNEKNEKKEKNIYGTYENVLLTDEEVEKLKAEYPEDWDKAIEILSAYIVEKGYKSKSHYLSIRRWCIKAAREQAQKPKPNSMTQMQTKPTDLDDLERKLIAN